MDRAAALLAIEKVLAREERCCVITADVLEALALLKTSSIPAAFFDPPYALGTREPRPDEILAWLAGQAELDHGGDFMGRTWSLPPVAFWKELHRVLMHGAITCFYGGTQTDDLLSMGARMGGLSRMDAVALFGHDRMAWCQAQGMPKHSNLGRLVDTAAGVEREVRGERVYVDGRTKKSCADFGFINDDAWEPGAERLVTSPETALGARWEGWHGGLAPKHEPLLLFQKPFARVNSDEIRAATGWDHWHVVRRLRKAAQQAAAAARFGVSLPRLPGETQILGRKPLHDGAEGWSELRWRNVCKVRHLVPVDARYCAGCGATREVRPSVALLCPACSGVETLVERRVERRWAPVARGPWHVLASSTKEPYRRWWTTGAVPNLLVRGVGALNIDASRVFTDWTDRPASWKQSGHSRTPEAEKIAGCPPGEGIVCHPAGRFSPNVVLFHTPACRRVGTRRVPGGLHVGTNTAGADKLGGALYGDGVPEEGTNRGYVGPDGMEETLASRCLAFCAEAACGGSVVAPEGGVPPACPDCAGKMRWACAVALLDEQSGLLRSNARRAGHRDGMGYGGAEGDEMPALVGSVGGASRFFPQIFPGDEPAFFYAAKASRTERDAGLGGRKNPGVCRKPIRFGRRQVRQIAPPGSVVLIPYCGTGSEIVAALLEGYFVIAIEKNPEDAEIARQQAEHVLAHGEDWIDADVEFDDDEPDDSENPDPDEDPTEPPKGQLLLW